MGLVHGGRRGGSKPASIAMAAPVDAVTDPIFVLESCLRERSAGSMSASLRDVWRMAQQRGFIGDYHQAQITLESSGHYQLTTGINEPTMIRPVRNDKPIARESYERKTITVRNPRPENDYG